MDAALIITTYNWPEALGITLRSVLGQSRRPEEVIVADDGSGPRTAEIVQETLGPADIRWCHARHADEGIRQARVKNLAVRYSRASYLIFIDHDVPLHRQFVADHLSMAREGTFLQGKRAFLPEAFTNGLIQEATFRAPALFLPGLENRKNAFRCPGLGRLLSRPKRFQTSLRGCNLSMQRTDFLEVDGYDEVFDQAWGREDSDICYRLFHRGVRIRNLWFSALQYHLYHRVIKSRRRDLLDEELLRNRREKRVRALQGFSRLSAEGQVVAACAGY